MEENSLRGFMTAGVAVHVPIFIMNNGFIDEAAQPEGVDAGLDDAARDEREFIRGPLREELEREPTDEEVDEWLRQHTEGY